MKNRHWKLRNSKLFARRHSPDEYNEVSCVLLQPLVPSLFSLVTLFQFDLLRLCKEPILVISIKCFYFLLIDKEPGKYQKGVGEASS